MRLSCQRRLWRYIQSTLALWKPFGVLLYAAKMLSGLACCSLVTDLENFQSRLRSFHLYHNGRNFFRLQDLSRGPQMPAMRRLGFLYPQNHILSNDFLSR